MKDKQALPLGSIKPEDVIPQDILTNYKQLKKRRAKKLEFCEAKKKQGSSCRKKLKDLYRTLMGFDVTGPGMLSLLEQNFDGTLKMYIDQGHACGFLVSDESFKNLFNEYFLVYKQVESSTAELKDIGNQIQILETKYPAISSVDEIAAEDTMASEASSSVSVTSTFWGTNDKDEGTVASSSSSQSLDPENNFGISVLDAGGKSPSWDHMWRIGLIGDSCVGKTNLITRFCDDVFKEEYFTKLDEFKLKDVRDKNGETHRLMIFDQAKIERFKSTKAANPFENKNAHIILFDLTNEETFINAQQCLREQYAETNSSHVFILVGTKSDLAEDRKVSADKINDFMQQNDITYVETSAKTGKGVNQAFCKMVEVILEREQSQKAQEYRKRF